MFVPHFSISFMGVIREWRQKIFLLQIIFSKISLNFQIKIFILIFKIHRPCPKNPISTPSDTYPPLAFMTIFHGSFALSISLPHRHLVTIQSAKIHWTCSLSQISWKLSSAWYYYYFLLAFCIHIKNDWVKLNDNLIPSTLFCHVVTFSSYLCLDVHRQQIKRSER